MRRGGVFWLELEAEGRRPVCVITRDEAIAALRNVVIALITSRARGLQSEVRLGPEDGLPRECVISLDNLHRAQGAARRADHVPRRRQVRRGLSSPECSQRLLSFTLRYAYYDRDADIAWFPTGESDAVVTERVPGGLRDYDGTSHKLVAIEVWSDSTRLPANLLDALPAPVPAPGAAA